MIPDRTPVTVASPIADLSYRSYEGPLLTHAVRWWVITKRGLQLIWSKPWIYILFGFSLIRFLFIGAILYFFSAQIMNMSLPGEPQGQKFALLFWQALCGDFNSMILFSVAL